MLAALSARRVALTAALVGASAIGVAQPPAASAYAGPTGTVDYGGFHSVMAAGEGHTANALDLANFEATGALPASFTDHRRPSRSR